MYSIILSPESFRTLVVSALEAYSVPNGNNHDPDKHFPLETIGSLWGYESLKESGTYYHVISVETDLSAERNQNWVAYKKGSLEIKSGFFERYHPELHYLGDFHSHPYSQGELGLTTARDVETRRYYRFSEGDFEDIERIKKNSMNYKVGVVTTIYKMRNVVAEPLLEQLDHGSVIRFTHTGPDADGRTRSFRCWIKAYIFANQDDAIPLNDRSVRLLCPSLGFLP